MATTSRRQQARARQQQPVDNVHDQQRGQPAVGPFWPVLLEVTLDHHAAPLSLCDRCAALVPASPASQGRHHAFHERVEGRS